MKILHISTSTRGGAGTAAIRLHKGLINEGVDSNFLTLMGEHQLVPQVSVLAPKADTLLEKIKRNLNPLTSTGRNVRRLQSKAGNYEAFTFLATEIDISEHPKIKEADIINLHWISGFFDYPSFFKKIKKPIVWTLHDMNPFMGGFHYKGDEIRNHLEFKNSDRKLKEQKRLLYQKATIKQVVSPSLWLKNESLESDLFRGVSHIQIPYGLDTNIFRPYNMKFAREVFQLPEERKILLFVAEEVSVYRKGFDLLLNAVKSLSVREECMLVAIGKIPDRKIDGVVYLGSVCDERLMALAYSAADAFFLPSREDNFPNVMLESLACGTPVIATPVGGMAEVIKDGINGYLSKDVTSDSFQIAVERFVQKTKNLDREKIRKDAETQFSLDIQAQKYIALYENVLNSD
jgi:glycosyltransferase involved in cell wall biosynthesis